MRTLKRPETPSTDPYKAQPLPTHRPICVYYRQSSEGQIGNISTTLQTVDMVEHLQHLGWIRERILMIDMDAGISGTKKIRERPGMSRVFDLIESGQVGAVAAQDVDRFFRDVTQIETNIFIDACKRNKVLVLTPNMVYDFAHPVLGSAHVKMFREEAQRAADFIEYQVRGKLVKARHYRSERGFWMGRKIAPGFMVDMRIMLPTGDHNPNYRKYVRFDPWADVALACFLRFQAEDGNLEQTWEKIQREGPFFPEIAPEQIPTGYTWRQYQFHRSEITGQLTPSPSGLHYLLTNVAYIGHWIHKQAITVWDNHEAIIPLDLFMFAYNRLSQTDFLGDPNPHYVPYRPWVRHDKAERQVEPPTYSYLVYSDDLSHHPHKQVSTAWYTTKNEYKYQLADGHRKSNVWNIMARIVDGNVDRLLLDRLQATNIDEAAWQQALDSMEHGDHAEIRRLETAIRQARQTKENLIASLGLLTNPEMVQRTQARYETADAEIAMLTAELERVRISNRRSLSLVQARPALEQITTHWDRVPRQEKRALLEGFATHIQITKLSRASKRLTIHWRDGSQSTYTTIRESRGYFWDTEDLEKLRQMVENNVDQVDILCTFPDYTWRSLQQRYAYKYGNGHWPKTYTGKRPYPRDTRWEDTKEAKAKSATQVTVSTTFTDRYK